MLTFKVNTRRGGKPTEQEGADGARAGKPTEQEGEKPTEQSEMREQREADGAAREHRTPTRRTTNRTTQNWKKRKK